MEEEVLTRGGNTDAAYSADYTDTHHYDTRYETSSNGHSVQPVQQQFSAEESNADNNFNDTSGFDQSDTEMLSHMQPCHDQQTGNNSLNTILKAIVHMTI